MRVTLESTPIIVELGAVGAARARRWEGNHEDGTPVVALVAAISPQTHDFAVAQRFAAELAAIEFAPPPEPDPPEAVDRRRAEQLTAGIMGPVLTALASRPPSRENVFVVLNALAVAAATVILGTDEEAREFFDRALAQNIADLRAQLAPTDADDRR